MNGNSDCGSGQLRAFFRLYGYCAGILAQYGVTLGYEAECAGSCGSGGIRGAVFRAEPGFQRVSSYVNGTEIRTGGFTVALRTGDADTASRCSAEETAMRLCEAFRTGTGTGAGTETGSEGDHVGGEGLSFEGDGVLLYGITPVSVPARLRMTPDGAVWETRFSYRVLLRRPAAEPEGEPEAS